MIKRIGENVVELKGLPERMPKVINTEYVHLYKRDDDPRLAALRQAPQPPRPHVRNDDGDDILRHQEGQCYTGGRARCDIS